MILDACNLTLDDFNEALEVDGIKVEDYLLLVNTNPIECAAMYLLTCVDDGSFPTEEDRYIKASVHYTRNGSIVVLY